MVEPSCLSEKLISSDVTLVSPGAVNNGVTLLVIVTTPTLSAFQVIVSPVFFLWIQLQKN